MRNQCSVRLPCLLVWTVPKHWKVGTQKEKGVKTLVAWKKGMSGRQGKNPARQVWCGTRRKGSYERMHAMPLCVRGTAVAGWLFVSWFTKNAALLDLIDPWAGTKPRLYLRERFFLSWVSKPVRTTEPAEVRSMVWAGQWVKVRRSSGRRQESTGKNQGHVHTVRLQQKSTEMKVCQNIKRR